MIMMMDESEEGRRRRKRRSTGPWVSSRPVRRVARWRRWRYMDEMIKKFQYLTFLNTCGTSSSEPNYVESNSAAKDRKPQLFRGMIRFHEDRKLLCPSGKDQLLAWHSTHKNTLIIMYYCKVNGTKARKRVGYRKY